MSHRMLPSPLPCLRAWSRFLVTAATVLPAGMMTAGEERPNFAMILVDDLNTYVGAYGHPNARTPHIDGLADRGTLFLDAHAQTALCAPSRTSIFSGLRPSTTGIYGQIDDSDLAIASEEMWRHPFLPEVLRGHGYHTMGVGKVFHQHAPDGQFDESGGRSRGFGPKPPDGRFFHWNEKGTSTDWGAFPETDEEMPDHATAQWAVERLEQDYDEPFFLAVGFLRPHVPFYAPPEWFEQYPLEEIVTPAYEADDFGDVPEVARLIDHLPMMPTTEWAQEQEQWRAILQAYLACVSFVDEQIGRVLDALDRSPHRENTYVILVSDHGYRLGEKGTFAKNSLWQEATRAPLVIAGPGIRSSVQVREVVELLDIYPTLLDFAGLPDAARYEGRSLRPLLEGTQPESDGFAISTFGRNNHAVITQGFRYIRYHDGSEELYDRWKDPHAFTNVVDDPTYAKVRERLRARLPERNRRWSPAASYGFVDYFASQPDQAPAAFDFHPEEALRYCVIKALDTARSIGPEDGFPVAIENADGAWDLRDPNRWGWTNGFWPGILWYAFEQSGDPVLRVEAEAFSEALLPVTEKEIRSHDIGFIATTGIGHGLRLTGEARYREAMIRAADQLLELFNPAAGTLLSWPARVHDGTYAPHHTIIDSLMNLELLFRATKLTGDERYRDVAIAHADTLMRTHVREDGSTCHLVIFGETGTPIARKTHQGFSADSTWARGQAWAVYGFTMAYRETGYERYRNIAEKLARRWIERVPDGGIPYWDFDDTAIPDVPRDASSAAIAASAMIELSSFVTDDEHARKLRAVARGTLAALSTGTFRTFDRNAAFLDHSTGNRRRDREVDVPIVYADYYYLEALLRLCETETGAARSAPGHPPNL